MSHASGPKRDFALLANGDWTFALGIRWPQPRESSDGCASQWYNRSFILVCPECARVWCRSEAHDVPSPLADILPRWCVRERHCADCMQAYYDREAYANPYDAWHPTYCPGTILSVSRHESLETPSSILWFEQLQALPAEWRYRELRQWALLDLLCNPPQPQQKEPVVDVSNSNASPAGATVGPA